MVYPESCCICATPISRIQDCGICHRCWAKALQQRIQQPWCPSCGLPYRCLEGGQCHLCGACTVSLPPYSGARAFGCYSSELSRIIQALKFDGRRNLTTLLAPLLASAFLESWSPGDIDLVAPVPLHPKRRRERGYNQAALLGRLLARMIGRPFCSGAMARERNTPPQVGLSDSDRARNVKHAFRCVRPAAIQGLRVLLVDDVMTTGSTVASACDALLAGGAFRVSVLTVARAVPGSE